jgi:hypothetical protein
MRAKEPPGNFARNSATAGPSNVRVQTLWTNLAQNALEINAPELSSRFVR